MFRRTQLPELLAPAGDFEALCAAVEAGADAVYVGGKSFGARAYAKNFDIDELTSAVEYCHIHGVKLYVTVNTLVFDRELAELSDYAAELWRIGVDAVICADLGAIAEIRRRVPGLEIHASTQMSVHNTYGAVAAADLGCSRVVPARELSLENIKSIVENSPVEIEAFLHGALCVCHSGQCLMSSMVGGRSGNRGECAQPCRLPYNKGKHVLSLKDLSLADHVTELIDSGVASLKIEGRMKSAEYVYTVTRIYRTLLDERRNAGRDETDRLARVFSRGGFTDGYFVGKTESKMTGIRSEADKEITRALEARAFEPRRVPARASVSIRLGSPSEMTLTAGQRTVTVTGAVPSEAISSPLNYDDVRARLSKTGNTYVDLRPENIDLMLDDGVNLPPSALNALRRDAVAKLQSCERLMSECADPCEIKSCAKASKAMKTAQFFNARTYLELAQKEPDKLSDFDLIFLPLGALPGKINEKVGVYIPPVIFDTECHQIGKMLENAADLGVKYALVGNIGAIELVRRYGLIPVGDFRLNVTNSISRAEYERLGVDTVILSPELTAPMARDIGGGVIVCGRIPLMITERCFTRDLGGCSACAGNESSLTDRTGARFPILREFEHRNVIFNSTLTYMGDKRDELRRAYLRHEHFIFSSETASEIAEIIAKYNSGNPLGKNVRRMGKR